MKSRPQAVHVLIKSIGILLVHGVRYHNSSSNKSYTAYSTPYKEASLYEGQTDFIFFAISIYALFLDVICEKNESSADFSEYYSSRMFFQKMHHQYNIRICIWRYMTAEVNWCFQHSNDNARWIHEHSSGYTYDKSIDV